MAPAALTGSGGTATESLNLRDQGLMTLAPAYFEWQAGLILPRLGRRVVDVGCGIGSFTRLLLDRDAVIAVDRDPDCIERLKARYASICSLHAVVADVTEADFLRVAAFEPDCCVCLNVLEHIEDDVDALRRMASVLAPGGVIALMVPAFGCLYGPIDRNVGHCRRYTRSSLRRTAAAAGLAVRSIRYMNVPGFFGWWANAHLFRREEQSAAQIRLFDRYIVPLASRLEQMAPPPFGQSLVAVLAKIQRLADTPKL